MAETYNIPIAETQAGSSSAPWAAPAEPGRYRRHRRQGCQCDRPGRRCRSSAWARVFSELAPLLPCGCLTRTARCWGSIFAPLTRIKWMPRPLWQYAKMTLECAAAWSGRVQIRPPIPVRLRQPPRPKWEAIVDDYYTKELPGGLNQTLALGIINAFMPNDAIALGSAGSLPGDMQRLFRNP